ncbi:MAG: hypothetical protein HC810_00815 [Acaryochloridaceae cyanobacterium RL_2_7]|nr:hypothetical protein [Acaryochloridaceae cyanobacterium RL_2_7]
MLTTQRSIELVTNLRQSRLEMQEVNLRLEEVIAELDRGIRAQNQRRLQHAMEMNEVLD